MRRLTKLLPVILALWGGTLRSQVVLTSIPEPVDGVVEVCLGSTVLFLNETDESELNLNTTFTWSLPDEDPVAPGPILCHTRLTRLELMKLGWTL